MPPLRLDTEKVESLRKCRKLTMVQASEACGLTKQRWSNIIHGSGQVMLETLGEIAKVLGVKPAEIIVEDRAASSVQRRAKKKGGKK